MIQTIEKGYSPKELLEILPIGRTTLYKMLRSGEIKACRIGKRNFAIKQSEIDRLLKPVEDIRIKRKRGRK